MGDDQAPDIAACLLKILSERGPQSISELLPAMQLGLSELLRALRDVQDLRLVEFVGEEHKVQLTADGSQTIAALTRDGIKQEAALLLNG